MFPAPPPPEGGPPPCPRPSSPRRDRDSVGDPRVSTSLGSPSSLGVESSHDDSTPPPFGFGVESSCHDLTPPPPPFEVNSSWDDSTPLPSLWWVDSSRENLTPPPHSVAATPRVFLYSGGLAAPLIPFHSVGIGVHSGGLTPPRVPPYSPGFCSLPSPAASFFVPLFPPCPMAALRRRLVGRCGGDVPTVAPAGPHIPPLPSRPAFLCAPCRRRQRGVAVGGVWGGIKTWTAMGWGTQESNVGGPLGETVAGRSEIGKATSAAANEAGAGGRHRARPGVRERVAGRRFLRGGGARRGAVRPIEWP